MSVEAGQAQGLCLAHCLSIVLFICLQLFCITAAKPRVRGGRRSNLAGLVGGSVCPWQGPPFPGLLWLEWLWRTP